MILLQTRHTDSNTCKSRDRRFSSRCQLQTMQLYHPLNAIGFTHYFSSRPKYRLERKCSLIKVGIVYKNFIIIFALEFTSICSNLIYFLPPAFPQNRHEVKVFKKCLKFSNFMQTKDDQTEA